MIRQTLQQTDHEQPSSTAEGRTEAGGLGCQTLATTAPWVIMQPTSITSQVAGRKSIGQRSGRKPGDDQDTNGRSQFGMSIERPIASQLKPAKSWLFGILLIFEPKIRICGSVFADNPLPRE